MSLRKHLIDHVYFDSTSIREWVDGKKQIESISGYRVRAVSIGGFLAGWCGIQADDNGFEIAIVIAKEFWGFGLSIFQEVMFLGERNRA